MTMRVMLIGATGLVGADVAARLGARGDVVLGSLVRRPGAPGGRVIDFADLAADPAGVVQAAAPGGLDVAISCLGTTIRAAGSEEAMWRVDHDLVLAFATGAKAAGARQMILMTSVGAGGRGFYLRMKGAVEAAVGGLGFARLDLVRPGLLLGPRPERRLLEGIGQAVAPILSPLMLGGLERYAALPGATVARAIVALAGAPGEGRFVHENRELKALS